MQSQHFNWLVLSIPLNKALFQGADKAGTSQELSR
ncbi:hypothetical protein SAMN05421806_1212 [Streptomyces indicus]|uniref:Uncharacterized protein n=1 Tax=Streptomyces indicus TaxID=417292 RepID=A0A1G9I0V8_9ACTN|nr:hypothetical protein SAMN05421806_1212 [Streptomyces indicus]